jgi:predicted nuclease of restriction endonuclease-like (RecB) superfamily
MKGFSARNLSRMRVFYKEYKDIQNWPPALANLPWTHNYILLEKVKEYNKRLWYAEKCLDNGWSKIILVHQIESDLYQRQKDNPKLTNSVEWSLDGINNPIGVSSYEIEKYIPKNI